jgi:hypothetical protein
LMGHDSSEENKTADDTIASRPYGYVASQQADSCQRQNPSMCTDDMGGRGQADSAIDIVEFEKRD